jgi:hypothetical protein
MYSLMYVFVEGRIKKCDFISYSIFKRSEVEPFLHKQYLYSQLRIQWKWVCRRELLCIWQPNGSVRFVCALRYPHSRLTLSYSSSITNSYFVTMEKISEQPEDHCFILQIKRTAGPLSRRGNN